ncbi:hypothetical protein ZIOFF_066048 [Zingiber officinale]|uniref:Reverse transcriptase Ty1/copia-type domain-containing protein n=1 Tax=Zingiber officinale TaxID=94328 RepID=A0A8J5EY75_ZINOF|nr:hypothetical protein ZIOFF_066048 [Zingiber officinale]
MSSISENSGRQRSTREEEPLPESTQRKKKPKRVRAPRPQEPDATAAVDRRGEAGVPPCSCSAVGDVKLCQSPLASPSSRGLRAKLAGVGATFIVRVMRKRITDSDIDPGQHRLLLPKNLLNRTVLEAAMQVEELAQAMAGTGLPVRALDRLGREYDLTLRFVSSAKGYRIIGRDYSRLVRENPFRAEQWIDVLVFRSAAGLGVALVEHKKDEEVVEDDVGGGEAAATAPSCLCGNSTEANLAAALIMLSRGISGSGERVERRAESVLMAPKGGRGKGKGERKKKDEKASAGFCCSPSVPPLALDVRVNLPDESHSKDKDVLIVCLYVDDLIFIRSNPSMFGEFKEAMTKEFEMTDIGLMAYYLGIEVNQREDGSFISQVGYAREILKKFRMDNSKSINTPVECGVKLSKHDEEEKVDPTFFKSLVGSLRYLMCTRPDILYAIGLVSRYMEDPTTTHLKIAKRILRYIKGTIDFGLLYSTSNHFKLEGYSDSD